MMDLQEETIVDDSVFEIGDPESDDELHLAEENEKATEASCQVAKGAQKDDGTEKHASVMKDPCYERKGENAPTARGPKYQPILATVDSDDDEEADGQPKRRSMLGYAAYHGSRFIPAEIKDNVEHFLANTPTAAPSFYVAPPHNIWGGNPFG